MYAYVAAFYAIRVDLGTYQSNTDLDFLISAHITRQTLPMQFPPQLAQIIAVSSS